MWEMSAEDSSGVSNGIKGILVELQIQALQMQFFRLANTQWIILISGFKRDRRCQQGLCCLVFIMKVPRSFLLLCTVLSKQPITWSFNCLWWLSLLTLWISVMQAYCVLYCSKCWAYSYGWDQFMLLYPSGSSKKKSLSIKVCNKNIHQKNKVGVLQGLIKGVLPEEVTYEQGIREQVKWKSGWGKIWAEDWKSQGHNVKKNCGILEEW